MLGLPSAGRVSVYYWQRLPNSERIDHDIDQALAEVEPAHTAERAQRTETDLLLVARDWLCPCEHKCGDPKKEPHGWRQRDWQQEDDSRLRHEYKPFFQPLLRDPSTWHDNGNRFAQLIKNLSLAVALSRRWSARGRPPEVHLGVIINERVRGKDGSTYGSEFDAFQRAVRHPEDHLHSATWQQIRGWLGCRQEPLCRLACRAMDENDWL